MVTSHDTQGKENTSVKLERMAQMLRVCVFVCTYNCEDEEARGDRSGAVEHDANVVTHQRCVVFCVGDQNWRQQEADSCPERGMRERERERERDRERGGRTLLYNINVSNSLLSYYTFNVSI